MMPRIRSSAGVFRLLAVLSVLCLSASGCADDPAGSGDAGADADADTDTDSDADSDAGPDGGGAEECAVDAERALEDLAYFASDELAGRAAGSEGNELALERAAALFEELGLAPLGDDGTYRQAFDVNVWSLDGEPTASLGGTALAYGTDFSVFDGSGSASLSAELVFAGYGMTVPAFDEAEYPDCPLPSAGYDDYAGIDATGKIAIVVRHGPGDDMTIPDSCPDNDLCEGEACLMNFSYKAENAIGHGAAGMILVQNLANPAGISGLQGMSISPAEATDFAVLAVDRDAVKAAVPDLETWIGDIDDSLTPQSAATGVIASLAVATTTAQVPTGNILGALEGTDPDLADEIVVVGGHIDHLGVSGETGEIYHGADDNASGAAVTMELARALSSCGAPARTVVFALWNGEEKGLLGSIYYVVHPAYPMTSTIAAFSVDMVGAGNGTGVSLYGATDANNAWLMDVMEGSAADMGIDGTVQPMVPIETLGYGSDNVPFGYLGVPNVLVETLGDHLYYHTPADTLDTIDIDDVDMAAKLVFAALEPLAAGTEDAYLAKGSAAEVAPTAPAVDHARERPLAQR
jgi:hypothetical protein